MIRARVFPALAGIAFLVASGAAADQTPVGIDPSIGKVEVMLDLPRDKPYVGEMIMLRMRSFIRADVVLDDLIQPPLTNFNWQQLGRDKPIEAMVDGFRVAGVERDLAIFPQQPGRLIIEPFVRRVTIAMSDNSRVEADFSSKPVYVDVQNYTAISPADVWWLPAKSLTLTDNWSVEPDEIKPGTLSRRTITVEAAGLMGDRLPPPPEMRAPGTIVFRGPVKRETILTPDGPIGRGIYQWDIRPVSSSPAKLPAIHVQWFDTTERRNRHAAIPDIWVAYIGTLVHPSHEKPVTISYLSIGPLVAGTIGFAWTVVLVLVLAKSPRRRTRPDRRRTRTLKALGRAARFDDKDRFFDALASLARLDPDRWAQMSRDAVIGPRLAALERARFGKDEAVVLPPLPRLASDLQHRFAERDDESILEQSALLPIDGGTRPAVG